MTCCRHCGHPTKNAAHSECNDCAARPPKATAEQIAHYLGLTEWQAKFLGEVMERAEQGERPVYRFLGRKIGYGWAWEKCHPAELPGGTSKMATQ